MADYIKLAAVADCVQFDGTQTNAEAIETAYPGIVSIAVEAPYVPLTGENALTPALTGVTGTFVTDEEGDETTAAVVTLTVTHACSANGNIIISILGAPNITVAVTTSDDSATKVATKIRAKTGTGFTLTGTGADVIFTQNTPTNGVLDVIDQNGEILNAYATQWIVFSSAMETNKEEIDKTEIWANAPFTKYFQAVES
jgi:hypothetical protein